jgi:hypothetical protein
MGINFNKILISAKLKFMKSSTVLRQCFIITIINGMYQVPASPMHLERCVEKSKATQLALTHFFGKYFKKKNISYLKIKIIVIFSN